MSTIVNHRQILPALAMAAAALVFAGCGDDDGGGDGQASGGGGANPPVADVQACLEEAGYGVERGSSASPELQERDGIEDHLGVTVTGDATGVGSVTFYRDGDSAAEGQESARLVRTDDVVIERVADTVYTYAGSGDGADVIAGCLG